MIKTSWDGPASWSDKQWKWKKRLRWNKECDYVGEIEIHPVSKTQQLIQVMCVCPAHIKQCIIFFCTTQKENPHNN